VQDVADQRDRRRGKGHHVRLERRVVIARGKDEPSDQGRRSESQRDRDRSAPGVSQNDSVRNADLRKGALDQFRLRVRRAEAWPIEDDDSMIGRDEID
jgi:hypothetical protein